ncbi:hypothetical protein QYF61_019469 [Mycteria americana]|uniref:Uncharacterized protein n=1 Tax=Mycteria americana TaxID=33587 RepID=A0AAN7NGY9_MYCAM|nr:hypothetical protein QYF61_019469 [Mycteria americana]
MGDPRWSSLFLKDCTPWKGPTLEQFVKSCSPWEGPTLEELVEDCLLWVGPHAGAGEEGEEEGAAETTCDEMNPALMLDNLFSEEIFLNIQSKPPLEQLEAISSHPITCYLAKETDPHLSTTSFQRAIRSPLSLLFSRLNNPSSLSCSSQDLCSRPFTSFVALLWTLSLENCLIVSGQCLSQYLSCSEGPKLNTVFEVRPHQCRVQGDNLFPSPAGHTIFDTSQDAIGLLGHLGTLLAPIQLAVDQHPQVFFHRTAFQPLFPKPVVLLGVVVTQVQDPNHRITESQNRIGWKRPLRSSSPTVNLTLPSPPLHHVPQHLIQTSFKYLQGW